MEPHFSAAIIIIAIGAVMLFLGGVRLYWFVGALIAALAALGVVMTFFPYASSRITTWLDPFANTSGSGYQIVQSLYAIGSGGLFGLGLGQGRQKYLYLPEEHNDFIFPVVCEELGFVGAIAILHTLRPARHPRLLARHAHARQIQLPRHGGDNHAAGHPGHIERRGGHEPRALHGHIAAVLLATAARLCSSSLPRWE